MPETAVHKDGQLLLWKNEVQFAGQLDLPLDILGGTPFDGRLAIGHSAIGIGPAPSGPLVGGLKAWAQKHQARDNEKQNSHEWSGQEDN